MAPPFLLPLLLLCSSSWTVQSQSNNHNFPPPPPSPYFNPKFNPSMAIIIAILITAFLFLGFFSIYLRQCGVREGSVTRRAMNGISRSRRGAAMRGLDQATIEKFPTLVYSDVKEHKIGKGALECAVCLCEFEDEETLRLLPKCDHVFHPECIDMWLSSHVTCPVCRANLSVVDADAPVATTAATSPRAETSIVAETEEVQEEAVRPDQVVISVAEEEREAEAAVDLRRMGSKRSARSKLAWRSRSARPAIGARAGQYWAEEERERFTLRLPEYVRRDVLAGKLRRSTSMAVLPREGSSLRGYRGEGSSHGGGGGGGRSFKMGRWDWAANSDRWAFLARPLSFKLSRSGGGDGEGSTRRGDMGGEGSTKGKVYTSPLDCLGGGALRLKGGCKEGDEEAPTVSRTPVTITKGIRGSRNISALKMMH